MDGKCQACDKYGEVGFNQLCWNCAQQLERDMIRKREWKYSVLAWPMDKKHREQLRSEIIEQYGEETELIE